MRDGASDIPTERSCKSEPPISIMTGGPVHRRLLTSVVSHLCLLVSVRPVYLWFERNTRFFQSPAYGCALCGIGALGYVHQT
jgi:hypothetical protein